MWQRMMYLTFALLLLVGCGQSFSGDYEDAIGAQYSFRNDGQVTIRILGTERVVPFTREGKTLKIGNPQDSVTLTLTILDDGTLHGEGLGGIMSLKKVK